MTIEQKLKEFFEKFPTKEQVIVRWKNDNGSTSWDFTKGFEYEIESFLLQTIKETREEVCKELIPEKREFPDTPVKWLYHGNGYRECRQEIINKAIKLK